MGKMVCTLFVAFYTEDVSGLEMYWDDIAARSDDGFEIKLEHRRIRGIFVDTLYRGDVFYDSPEDVIKYSGDDLCAHTLEWDEQDRKQDISYVYFLYDPESHAPEVIARAKARAAVACLENYIEAINKKNEKIYA